MAAEYANNSSGNNTSDQMQSMEKAPLNVSPIWMSPSFSNNARLKFNEYEPEEDYKFIPVSQTDPWFTPNYINTFHTQGGEYFIKRNDGTEPASVAETYVGPYYRWVREPQYSDKRKRQFGTINDVVIGESFYGRGQAGRPKNKGLRKNQVLEPMLTILREELNGPIFIDAPTTTLPDPPIVPSVITDVERKEASKQGILLDETADLSDTISGAIILKNTGNKKFIHVTDLVSLIPAASILGNPDTNMGQLAPTGKAFGLKGRPPIITNQPNAKIDFGDDL